MTEQEEKNYVCKRDVYRALLSIATSFIGALLALLVFAGLHRPPVVPGKFPPPPCNMQRMIPDDGFRGPHMREPGDRFRGKHFKKDFKGDRPDIAAGKTPVQHPDTPKKPVKK